EDRRADQRNRDRSDGQEDHGQDDVERAEHDVHAPAPWCVACPPDEAFGEGLLLRRSHFEHPWMVVLPKARGPASAGPRNCLDQNGLVAALLAVAVVLGLVLVVVLALGIAMPAALAVRD